ncbi:MAG: hypothetical protein E7496_10545 [Ruminococcus sp.]|nr:hypothetical protein [Ruminococcus sp.]
MLTVNTFLALLLKAKREGKGKISNGMFLIKLISTLSDDNESDIIKLFTIKIGSERDKELNRIADRLVKNSAKYPHPDEIYGVKLTKFQRLCGQEKPNSSEYKLYLERMNAFCRNYLNHQKYTALVYSLLEFLHQDENSRLIFYDNQFINKSEFFGNYAHPKKVCLEALLVGLWYQVQMSRNTENAKSVELLALPAKLSFYVFLLTDSDEYAFRKEYSVLKSELNLDAPVNLLYSLRKNAESTSQADFCRYSLQLKNQENRLLSESDFWNQFHQHSLLYGSEGTGKSEFLRERIRNHDDKAACFLISLSEYCPDVPHWILIQILLKYHYQNFYQSYDACIACETESVVHQKLTELFQILKKIPADCQPDYVLFLDGMNEIIPENQDFFIQELQWIHQNLKNVRILLTSRTTPAHTFFEDFQKFELCGIPEESLADLAESQNLIELLKVPVFLNLFLEHNSLRTKGELLDFYIMNYAPDNQMMRFLVQYALPIAVRNMLQNHTEELSSSDLSDAINTAFEMYLCNSVVYEDFLAPKHFQNQLLLQEKKQGSFIFLLLECSGFLAETEEKIRFTQPYFIDYFAAKYILNLSEMLDTVYHINFTDLSKELIETYRLNESWFGDSCDRYSEIYKLIEEINHDCYKNSLSYLEMMKEKYYHQMEKILSPEYWEPAKEKFHEAALKIWELIDES